MVQVPGLLALYSALGSFAIGLAWRSVFTSEKVTRLDAKLSEAKTEAKVWRESAQIRDGRIEQLVAEKEAANRRASHYADLLQAAHLKFAVIRDALDPQDEAEDDE